MDPAGGRARVESARRAGRSPRAGTFRQAQSAACREPDARARGDVDSDTKRSVVVGHNHSYLRAALTAWLTDAAGVRVVGQAGSVEEAIGLLRVKRPELCIFDLELPGTFFVEAISDIRRIGLDTKLMLLGERFIAQHIRRTVRMGVQSIVLKTETPEFMLHAVRTVLDGGEWFSKPIGTALEEPEFAPPAKDAESTLTRREVEILHYIVVGMERRAMATTMHISPRTVDRHVERLMMKLNLHKRSELIKFALREGFEQA